MKKFTFMLALIGLLLMLSVGMVAAQDEPDAGDAPPAATLEAVATLIAVTEDGQVTPVVVTTPAVASINWQIIFTSLLAIIIVVDRITGQGLQKILARMIEPEKAQALYEAGVRFGLQVALNNAAKTPDKTDDLEWMRQAKDAGYTATLQADGTYALARTPPIAG